MRAKTNKKGINLGRIWNKYLIIDIFFSAGEEYPQKETEIVLWQCSRMHRIFLPLNFSWYSKSLFYDFVMSLKAQSRQIETLKQAQFL